MLAAITIRDFAIIEELTLSFGPGLSILTGETGAGKSILVDALGLVLGDKSNREQVRSGAAEAVVTAAFSAISTGVRAWIEGRGLPAGDEGELILERRVGKDGRSRCYLNGTAVPLGHLAELGSLLVDIHGQHQHQSLLDTANHVLILDDYGHLARERAEFRDISLRLAEIRRRMEQTASEARQRAARRDFLRFQLAEIEAAALLPGEEEDLDLRRTIFQNAEKIHQLIGEAVELVYEGEAAAVGQVEAATLRLAELARTVPGVQERCAELTQATAALRETVAALHELAAQAEYDPEMHNEVEERLALIGRLKRKYGASVAEVLATMESMRSELEAIDGQEENAGAYRRERDELLLRQAEIGAALSRERCAASARLAGEVMENLKALGMERARFAVRLAPRIAENGDLEIDGIRYNPGEGGLEDVEFLLAANPGEPEKGLARVASGGELSRIMLAIKTALAAVDRVECLIFDEIDTGIGGAVARTVGRKLRQLAVERQVICVTHLPQIASLGNMHFLVRKETRGGRPRVVVRALGARARVEEIARMLAGEKVTDAALRHARELMEE